MNLFKVNDLVQLKEGKVCQVLRICAGVSQQSGRAPVVVQESEPRYEVLIHEGGSFKIQEVPESLLEACW